jgi:hypothetical protein
MCKYCDMAMDIAKSTKVDMKITPATFNNETVKTSIMTNQELALHLVDWIASIMRSKDTTYTVIENGNGCMFHSDK